ncbi:hypothetical protein [Aquabacterium sp. J223]|uniref:hypothetical protein n=1 Tax=Aquabacterium sp. J223 TaxID=2898431 RepID=UPI0021AD575B|nr:hypothetical protein [Aquabacterium sp. J223]UUX95712.1 hypothetical protein LRS07_21380 [Aquabacterium sp. J223]
MQEAVPSLAIPVLLPGLASHAWAYPALEVVHLAGIALLLGNLVAFELRLWGVSGTLPLRAFAGLALGLSLAGFGLAAASGLLMFASQPGELLANAAFKWKLGLLLLAGVNAAAFHARGGLVKADGLARAQTLLSVLLWLAVLVCGRWIAYA